MGKKLLAAIAVTIALLIGVAAVLALRPTKVESPPAQSSNTQQNSDTSDSTTTGLYAEYSEDSLAKAKGVRLLFFHASWCPQCRALEADIKASQIPGTVTIFKVDYDTNQALRQKYGVTVQTSIVRIDDQGNLVEKYVAYSSPTLQTVLDNLL